MPVERRQFGLLSLPYDRYLQRQQQFNTHFANTLIAQGIPTRLMEVFALTGLFLLIALHQKGGYAGPDAIITTGAFMAAAYKIIPGIVKILNTIGQVQTYSYIAEGLQEATASENDKINIRTNQDNSTMPFPAGTQTAAPGKPLPTGKAIACHDSDVAQEHPTIRHIQFDGVSFSYGKRAVLRNLSWSLQPGDFIGIAGHSGQGKTTSYICSSASSTPTTATY